MEDALKSLLEMEFFKDFTLAELKGLFDTGTLMQVKPGAVLFEEGSDNANVYLLITGEVEVFKKDPHGKQQSLSPISKGGAVIGDMAWALEKKRGATVKAKKESTLLQLDGEKLRNAVLKGGVGATRFAYTMIKMQALRLDNMNQQLLKIIGAPTDKKKTTEIDNLRDKVLKGWSF